VTARRSLNSKSRSRCLRGKRRRERSELHEEVVSRCPAIDPQLAQRYRGVALHGLEQVCTLEGDRLERRTSDVTASRTAGDADDRATGERIPIRAAETRERRNNVDAAVVRHAGGECLNVLGPLHEAETVAQPLNHGAPHKNATLEGVLQAMTMKQPVP
jgi:hypothetical protein